MMTLALGSIDESHWQDQLYERIKDFQWKSVFYNNYNEKIIQDHTTEDMLEHVKWESYCFNKASLIFCWFGKTTPNVDSLMFFGHTCVFRKPTVIGMEPDAQYRDIIESYANLYRPDLKIIYDFESFCKFANSMILMQTISKTTSTIEEMVLEARSLRYKNKRSNC